METFKNNGLKSSNKMRSVILQNQSEKVKILKAAKTLTHLYNTLYKCYELKQIK